MITHYDYENVQFQFKRCSLRLRSKYEGSFTDMKNLNYGNVFVPTPSGVSLLSQRNLLARLESSQNEQKCSFMEAVFSHSQRKTL